MRRAKGQTMITLALFTGIAIVGIGVIITATTPVLENLRDSAAVDSANTILSDLQEQLDRVSEGGAGSQVTTSLSFSRGTLLFDETDDEVAYEIDTESQIIAPHTSKKIGNLLLSASASTSVTEAEVDGQDCWRIENDHVQVCIRSVDSPDDAIGADTVGFWRFSRGAGQVVVDNSSRGNNGTLGSSSGSGTDDPSRVGGLRGNALDFDGSDDHVEVENSKSLNITDAITLSAWVKTNAANAADGSAQGIIDTQEGSSHGYRMTVESGALEFGIYGGDDGASFTELNSDTSVDDNRWHHVAGTWDGSDMQVFVDGQTAGSATQSALSPSPQNFFIGVRDVSNGFFNGNIDEVRVYNTSLTAEEIQYLYNSSGYLNYVDTREMLLNYRNKDEGQNLSADFKLKIDTGLGNDDAFTMNGTGTVTPTLTGQHLGRGRVTADIESFYGIDYQIIFQLFSGSDFLQARVEENVQ